MEKKPFEEMTRKELAQNLYKTKIQVGEPLIPIGSKKSMSEDEFVKRYLNGVGGTSGFKKAELISLNERYERKARVLNEKRKK